MKRNLLFVFIVTLLAAMPLAIYSADKDGGFMKSARHRGFEGKDSAMGLMKMFKLADDLEITNPQLLQLRMLFQKNCNAMKKNDSKKDLFKQLSDPALKEEDVKKLAAEAGKAAEERILARFNMMQEIKKILTPEQLKKLEELKNSHVGKRGHRKNSKTGMGKGPGQRFNHEGKHKGFFGKSVETVVEESKTAE